MPSSWTTYTRALLTHNMQKTLETLGQVIEGAIKGVPIRCLPLVLVVYRGNGVDKGCNLNTCPECSTSFTGKKETAIFCSVKCKDRNKAKRRYESKKTELNRKNSLRYHAKREDIKLNTNCVECSGTISSPSLAKKYCCDSCRTKAKYRRRSVNRKHTRWGKIEQSTNTHKRRAKAYGVPYESFDKDLVFERDRWVCQICYKPIDNELKFPDPGSASLDHVMPLVAGGSHSADNSQASHLVCNLRKATRVPTMSR